jgi:hypothetical protein
MNPVYGHKGIFMKIKENGPLIQSGARARQ